MSTATDEPTGDPAHDGPSAITLRARVQVREEAGHDAWAVAWSCDGQRLAMVSNRGGSVWTADPGGWEYRPAFELGHGSEGSSGYVAWSPTDPHLLAQCREVTVTLLRVDADGRGCSTVWRAPYPANHGHRQNMSFSPDGARVAVADGGPEITILDVSTGKVADKRPAGFDAMEVGWSPSGDRLLALGSRGHAAIIPLRADLKGWDVAEQRSEIMWSAWSPDGRLAWDAGDAVHVWDGTGLPLVTLEGHTGNVVGVEFSHDGRLLYSVGRDQALRVWRTDTWQCVAVVPIEDAHYYTGGLRAHPTRPMLARRTQEMQTVELYEVDVDRLLGTVTTTSRTYANAKVLLLGDTGVGKSGLGLVLSGQPYRPTDSTHARQVWTFDTREVELPEGHTETREILLWDLAGQPGYRLIHQLHLAEAAAALVVFDARSEADPFAGVRYWMRALRHYRQGGGPSEVPAILVAARVDRGGVPVSPHRLAAVCDELGVVAHLETSAKEGRGVAELAEAIHRAIDWSTLPRSISTELFETIKRFLLEEKATDRVLASGDDLFRLYTRRHPEYVADGELRAGFDTCVRLLERRDLVRRLSFGGFVLLRPELLDAYASAIIDAARGQPDGLGYMAEDDALAGRFPIPEDARLPGPGEERLLLIATVEELLRHDLALREPTDGGVDLIFPSQFTQDPPDAPDTATTDVAFRFEGAVKTVYATLAVRLSHVAAYRREEMWRNASTYRAKVGGLCGLRVRDLDEGRGELTLFFDEAASEETRFLFEDYVHAHLTARALPGSVRRERVFTCGQCGYRLPGDLVHRRQGRGDTSMTCPDCERVKISLLDREDRLGAASMREVREMNATADATRDLAAATATIRGKETAGDYDVFLSYNTRDRATVAMIAERLRADGILPWFDTADIEPGQRWHDELERRIRQVDAGAVFVGPHGLGPWQDMEQRAFVHESARREFRIIPVLLPDAPNDLVLPVFLSQWHAVDCRVTEPDPFQRLRWAITGERWQDAPPV
ncbi:TIR domain-containing protein [Phytohabitans rumicis]|uniref:TIR domain-containing protein n=1 Tax=Phytohabitans rumicis TaxID=1076125 RepID=A0A6V8LIM0_9ACTN|nr:TIR domain-containing protein [Phytohabitans rumicis]GFJ94751.1 hypothetical protein Prum_083930 [Phytohabitans rumicis]